MDQPPLSWIANFIWGIADDVLRDLYVRGKYRDVILPLSELIEAFGVALHVRPTSGPLDRGGKRATNDRSIRCTLGAQLEGDRKLQHVYSGGPAERAGMAPGDTLVAFDGIKASAEVLATLLERRSPGDRVHVHAFRRDELRTFDVELAAAPHDTCYLTLAENATPQMLRRRAEWLGTHDASAATSAPMD